MLNYCTHAIEDFTNMLSKADKSGNPVFHSLSIDHLILKELIGFLHSSVKFHLPVNGEILDHNKASEIISKEIFRLPFPVCALEYEYTNFIEGMSAQGKVHVPKRIALCLEYEAVANTLIGKAAFSMLPDLAEYGGIIMVPFFWGAFDGVAGWAPTYAGVVALRSDLEDTKGSLFYSMTPDDSNKPAIIHVGVLPFVVLPTLLQAYIGKTSMSKQEREEISSQIMMDCAEEFYSMSNLMVALSCSNVGLHDSPASAKLNKKRLQSGKPPMFDYKEVVVQTDKPDGKGHGASFADSGRTYREHLRRGHIRRINGGERRIWIQSTIVNAGKGPSPHLNYRVK